MSRFRLDCLYLPPIHHKLDINTTNLENLPNNNMSKLKELKKK